MSTPAIPVLETARLRLRAFQPGDADAYHAAVYGDVDVTKYLPGGAPRPIERTYPLIDAFNASWDKNGIGGLAVIVKADGQLIGHCGLIPMSASSLPDPEVEVFYAIGKAYWGQGLVTEAARAVIDDGFTRAGLERIVAVAVPANTASRRVMEKLGMRYEGMTSRYYNAELAYYALSRDDWDFSRSPER